jgi:hypothetical protein
LKSINGFIDNSALKGITMFSGPNDDPGDMIVVRKCLLYDNENPELISISSPILTYSHDFNYYGTTFSKGIYSIKLATKSIA